MKTYQICKRCIMDTSDSEIVFDVDGICNHCHQYDNNASQLPATAEEKQIQLEKIISRIKKDGIGKEYDCISGVSGGVDSTYLTYMLKKLGLRVLVVHLDNGWNSELAVMNVENIVSKLGVDLFTKVLNWEEFRELQLAYLKASVLDLEALTDHAIFATLYKTASKYDVKYIINGSNQATEGILPYSWRYANKLTDDVNIIAINREFGSGKIKDFPLMSIQKFAWYKHVKKIETINLLDYLPYDKDEAKKIITEELGWRDYGGKHYESIITRFYQGYILPKKFGIDKRRAHLATLVLSGTISREKALEEIKSPFMDAEVLRQDMDYVPKKLGISNEKFEELMQLPPRHHTDYKSDSKRRQFLFGLKKMFSK